MTAQRLAPDALLVQTNLTGSVGDVQDDPDSPDAAWLTAASVADVEARVSFPVPTSDLTTGAGVQEFRVLVRKTASGGTNPSCTFELYENGALLTTLVGGQAISSTAGTVLSGTWDATSLAAISGADVECRVFGKRSGGSPANRRVLDIGAIEWNADYSEAGITGTFAATEAVDTAAIIGDVDVSCTLAAAEASDIAAIASDVDIAGTLAAGETADTAALAGGVRVAGLLAATEASDIAAIAGNLAVGIIGSLAATEAADTAAITGAVTIASVLSASEPIDVAAFVATLEITGSLAASETSDMAALFATLPGAGNLFQPWIYQVDACRQGPIVAEGRRQNLTLDVVFDPVKAEIS